MESKTDLKALDRAAAAPFIDYPKPPPGYPVLMGAWFGSIACSATLGVAGHHLVAAAILLVGCVALGAFFGWYRRKWGTWPDMGQAPPEIGRAYRMYLGVMLVALVVAGFACWLGGPIIGTTSTFAISTCAVWWYERRVYPAACARVRARLA